MTLITETNEIIIDFIWLCTEINAHFKDTTFVLSVNCSGIVVRHVRTMSNSSLCIGGVISNNEACKIIQVKGLSTSGKRL